MKCPYCGKSRSRVIDTRAVRNGIRRRRKCQACGRRFTTYERAVSENPVVIKRDGRREEFDWEKLLAGVRKACGKRPIPSEDIEGLVNQVKSQVYTLGKAEVESKIIGEMVLEGLKDLDEIAYIRFAAIHYRFADAEDLVEEIRALKEQKQGGKPKRGGRE